LLCTRSGFALGEHRSTPQRGANFGNRRAGTSTWMNGPRLHRKSKNTGGRGSLTQLRMAALTFVTSLKNGQQTTEATPSNRDCILSLPPIKEILQRPGTAFAILTFTIQRTLKQRAVVAVIRIDFFNLLIRFEMNGLAIRAERRILSQRRSGSIELSELQIDLVNDSEFRKFLVKDHLDFLSKGFTSHPANGESRFTHPRRSKTSHPLVACFVSLVALRRYCYENWS